MKMKTLTRRFGRSVLTWVWWVDADGNEHTPELDPFRGAKPSLEYVKNAWAQVQSGHTWEDFYEKAQACGLS